MGIEDEPLARETEWPETENVSYEELAEKIVEFCHELNRRERESRERTLKAAQEIWPLLREALRSKGRGIGLNNLAEPVMPYWADQPVVPLEGYYDTKRRTKKEAMELALSVGSGGWTTIGELWLWVGGGGPIVDRTLEYHGFLKKDVTKKC